MTPRYPPPPPVIAPGGDWAAPDGFRDDWRTVDGLRLHALVTESSAGAGDVVLLPGLVTASRSLVPLARELAGAGRRVWALDPAGFGYSDKPPHALGVDRLADVTAGWLRESGLVPAVVVANSFGTQVAAALAAQHDDVVERLVLVSPTPHPVIRAALGWLRRLPVPPARRGLGRRRIRALAALHRRLGEPPLRLLNLIEYACASVPRAVGTVRAAAADDIARSLSAVRAPTLILRSDGDHLSTRRWAGGLARGAPNARFAAIPGTGHAGFHETPERVARMVVAFLDTPASPARPDAADDSG